MRYLKSIVNCRILFMVSCFGGWINPSFLQAKEVEDPAALLNVFAHTNHILPMETAGSHGIDGFKIGAGLHSFRVIKDAQLSTQNYMPSTSHSSFLNRNNISILKGLDYPWDIGFSLSRSLDERLLQASGFIQWTLYEAFLMPAIALRSGISYLRRTPMEINSFIGSLVTSWGFGPFSLYGEYSLAWHNTQFFSPKLLQDTYKSQFFTSSKTLGLQYIILPPLLGVAAELSYKTKDIASYSFKVTFGT